MKFVQRNVVAHVPNFFQPGPPYAKPRCIRKIAYVIEEPGAGQNLFTSGVVANLKVDPRGWIALSESLERWSVHNKIAEAVISENKHTLDSIWCKLSGRDAQQISAKQQLNRPSNAISYELLYPHSYTRSRTR